MLPFSVSHWISWAPEYLAKQDAVNELHFLTGDKPNLDFLKPLERRRLSETARAAFACYENLPDIKRHTPLVFSSVHGESHRTYNLVQTVATDQEVSPTVFSLSVHNALAGQLSIHRNSHATAVSIASGDAGVLPGLLEALGTMNEEGVNRVVLCFFEEPLPVAYSNYCSSTAGVTVVFLLLSRLEKRDNFELIYAGEGDASSNSTTIQDQMTDLLDLLTTKVSSIELPANGSKWICRSCK